MPKSFQTTDEQHEHHMGRVLRARRREIGMSQTVLAKRMATSQEVVSNWENGVTPVRADALPRLARILKMTPTFFFQRRVGGEIEIPFSYAEKDDGRFPLEGERVEYTVPGQDLLALQQLSEADKEAALLIYYRRLKPRMKTIAVRLVREMARDERETQDPEG